AIAARIRSASAREPRSALLAPCPCIKNRPRHMWVLATDPLGSSLSFSDTEAGPRRDLHEPTSTAAQIESSEGHTSHGHRRLDRFLALRGGFQDWRSVGKPDHLLS